MVPLAERLRPKTLADWLGQNSVMGEGELLRQAFARDEFSSFILYGPPGTGKTTIFRLIKEHSKKSRVVFLNAVTSGVKDVKDVIEGAKLWKGSQNQSTILLIDEIHRFNKAQQDVLLAAVEKGDIILVGATTENPSYELNAALLSRCKVIRFDPLGPTDLLVILKRAQNLIETETGKTLSPESGALEAIADAASGDARLALNFFEWSLPELSLAKVERVLARRALQHDKTGDMHHQVVSAFIKSMRASQVDAALYYLARLWEAGEDPLYIARRMVIFASEDVGNADIRGLAIANAVRQACEFVGRPECYYALAQGVIFLSKAPKSRDAGDQFQKALEKVQRSGHTSPPNFLINANTKLDRELGRGRARNENESYLPEGVEGTTDA